MSQAWQFYIATLVIYAFVYIIAASGLNLQFGVAGVYNFAFIVFQAAGAYTTAVLSLGRARTGIQTYILGLHLPFPVPLLVSAVVAGLLGVGLGAVTIRRLRADYLAIALLVVSLIGTDLVTNATNLFNGATGLSQVPQPFVFLTSSTTGYDWLYAGYSGLVCAVVLIAVRAIIRSPLGRSLRALRENEHAAAALGKNVAGMRLFVFGVGGAIAGISGSILVSFTQAWAPSSWLYGETFVLFTALIVGGVGSNLGPVLGALLVPVVLAEGSRYLPAFGAPTLVPSLEWIAIGVILIVFLWFRPQGVIPEGRRRFSKDWRTAPLDPGLPNLVEDERAGLVTR